MMNDPDKTLRGSPAEIEPEIVFNSSSFNNRKQTMEMLKENVEAALRLAIEESSKMDNERGIEESALTGGFREVYSALMRGESIRIVKKVPVSIQFHSHASPKE
jgi:hypothetical protein